MTENYEALLHHLLDEADVDKQCRGGPAKEARPYTLAERITVLIQERNSLRVAEAGVRKAHMQTVHRAGALQKRLDGFIAISGTEIVDTFLIDAQRRRIYDWMRRRGMDHEAARERLRKLVVARQASARRLMQDRDRGAA